MKIRIYFLLAALSVVIWSCDEPVPFETTTFIYNPFSIEEDTLNNVTDISSGAEAVDWGNHLRVWVGETRFYKSGFSVGFTFNDTVMNPLLVDSVQFQMIHQHTFPENGADTLETDQLNFGLYEITDQNLDVNNPPSESWIYDKSQDITDGDRVWSYTLPEDLLVEGDSLISLGVFPVDSEYLSSLYGGGSVSGPRLIFYSHEADVDGEDSVTTLHSIAADTLFMHVMEKSAEFDRSTYDYISQFTADSIVFTIDLTDVVTTGDTLLHIVSSKFLPAIDTSASQLYTQDSVLTFEMSVTDPVTEYTASIELSAGNSYINNQINVLVQTAIDEERNSLELVLKPDHVGYDPGFIAISNDPLNSATFVSVSKAVKP